MWKMMKRMKMRKMRKTRKMMMRIMAEDEGGAAGRVVVVEEGRPVSD
jgi:hypothetical protein